MRFKREEYIGSRSIVFRKRGRLVVLEVMSRVGMVRIEGGYCGS